MAFILGGNTSIYLASVGISAPLPNPAQILGANYYDHWDYTDPTTLSVTGTDINSCTSKGINGAVMASTGTVRPKILAGQINGYQVADFDGINDFASVPASTAMYNFLHNGDGGTVIIISNPNNLTTSSILGNSSVSTNVGTRITSLSTNLNTVVVTRGVSGLTVNSPTTNNFLLNGYNLLISVIDADNATVNQRCFTTLNGITSNNNAETNPVSISNATADLNICRRPLGDQYYKTQIAEILIANTIITPQQQTDLQNYYNNKYGSFPVIPYPLTLANTQLYLAKNTATVSLWNDQSPNLLNMTQVNAIEQPIITANSVDFDGINDFMINNTANVFSGDTSGYIFFSGYYNSSSVNRIIASADTSTALLYQFQLLVFANKVSLNIGNGGGANYITLNTTSINNGDYYYGWIRSDGSSYSGMVNGVSQTINTTLLNDGRWWNFATLRDNLTIGGIIGNSNLYGSAQINKLYYNNGALTPTELANLEAFFADPNKY